MIPIPSKGNNNMLPLISRAIRHVYRNKNLIFRIPDPRKVRWVRQGSYEIINKQSSEKILGTTPLNPCSAIVMSARDHLGLLHFDRVTTCGDLRKFYNEFTQKTGLNRTNTNGTNFLNVYYFSRTEHTMIPSEVLFDLSPRHIMCTTRNLLEHMSLGDKIKLNFFDKCQRVIKIERSVLEDIYKHLPERDRQMGLNDIPKLRIILLRLLGIEAKEFVDKICDHPEILPSVIGDMANRSTYIHIDKPNRFFLSSRELQFLKYGLIPDQPEILTSIHKKHVELTSQPLIDFWKIQHEAYELSLG